MDWSEKTRNKFQFVMALWMLAPLLTLGATVSGLPASVVRLTQFDATRGDGADSNVNASRISVTLPDSWRDHQQKPFNTTWYRTTLELRNRSLPFAVYIPRLSMNVSVLINGVEIGNGGQFSEPISRNHGRPLIFFVPTILTEGINKVSLTLRVTDNEWALGYLGPVYVGDPPSLTNMYRIREFWQVQFTVALALLMLLFSIASFSLFARRRKETYFFWFGAAMALFALDTLNVFVTNIPISRRIWETYNQGIVFAFAITTVVFVHRFTRVGWRKCEPILWAMLGVKIVLLLIIDLKWFYHTASIFNFIVIGYGLVLAICITTCYVRTRSFETATTAFAGAILLGFAFHTWLIQAGILSPENLHLIHLGAPCFFFLIAFTLVNRFLRALDDTETLASQLDVRVREKEQELAATYETLSVLNQKRALTDERARIMREVHDGFGGQLIGALAMLESDNVNCAKLSNYIKTSLLDLRVMIDSLDPNTREVSIALGMLRTRVEPILKTRNLSLAWDLEHLPENLELIPSRTLNLLRVLQELITNIVKHSVGDQIKFKASAKGSDQQKTLVIHLWENGNGFESSILTGKGLSNVRKRMLDLDGEIYHRNHHNGFETVLVVPGLQTAQ